MRIGANFEQMALTLGESIYNFNPLKNKNDLKKFNTLRAQVLDGLRSPAKLAVDQAFKNDPVLSKILKHVKEGRWFPEGELTSTKKTFILSFLQETERQEKDFLGNVDHVRERLIKDHQDVYGCSSSKSEMKSAEALGNKSPSNKGVEELEVDCRKCGGKKKATASKCREPCFGGRKADSSEMQQKEAKKMKAMALKEESKNKEEKKSKKKPDMASDEKEVVEKKRKKTEMNQDEHDQDDPFKKDKAKMEDNMTKKMKLAMNQTIDEVMNDVKKKLREEKKRADENEKKADEKDHQIERLKMRNDLLKREKANLEDENSKMARELAKYQEDAMQREEEKKRVYKKGAPTSSDEEGKSSEDDSGNNSGDECEQESKG